MSVSFKVTLTVMILDPRRTVYMHQSIAYVHDRGGHGLLSTVSKCSICTTSDSTRD
jgi:hypothetical protein